MENQDLEKRLEELEQDFKDYEKWEDLHAILEVTLAFTVVAAILLLIAIKTLW